MCADITIRNISYDDISEVSKTLAQCWKSAYKGIINEAYLSSLEDTHWVDFLTSNLNQRSIDCVVAESGGKIIGVAIFGKSITEKYPNDGEVISLYVNPEYFGRHTGQALFEKALQALKEQGYANCTLCTFKANARAIGFYEAHGFEIVSQVEKIKMGEQEVQYFTMRKEGL